MEASTSILYANSRHMEMLCIFKKIVVFMTYNQRFTIYQTYFSIQFIDNWVCGFRILHLLVANNKYLLRRKHPGYSGGYTSWSVHGGDNASFSSILFFLKTYFVFQCTLARFLYFFYNSKIKWRFNSHHMLAYLSSRKFFSDQNIFVVSGCKCQNVKNHTNVFGIDI